MTDKKEAEISVFSVIYDLDPSGLPAGDGERAESCAEGTLSKTSEGGYLLAYEEQGEGGEVRSELLIFSDSLRLRKSGSVVSDICFRTGEEYRTVYSVPPYKFDMTVRTRRADISASHVHTDIRLVYDMNIGGADRRVNMRITARVRAVN